MTDSTQELERRYRRLLDHYPRSYREQHGEDMLGVLMSGADSSQRRPRLSERIDLLRGALIVHARYWWQMRTGIIDTGGFPTRHPLFVIRVRLATAVWLCVVTAFLIARGYWWLAALVAIFIPIHLVLAYRIALRRRTG